jgi:hypothetical protein
VSAEGSQRKNLKKLTKVQTRREIRMIQSDDENDRTYKEEEYYVVEP